MEWIQPARVRNRYCVIFMMPDINGKGKGIPVTGLRGLEGSRRLRLPDFMTLGT